MPSHRKRSGAQDALTVFKLRLWSACLSEICGCWKKRHHVLTNRAKFPNIHTRACVSWKRGHREVDGVSSNGRTAVSGAVCGGSTPPTPAISTQRLTYVAPSSSGLGRRPLKAEVAGSNPVGATKYPGQSFVLLAFFLDLRCQSRIGQESFPALFRQ